MADSPDAAIRACRGSGVLLLLGAPPLAHVSVDTFSFSPTAACAGVKLLAPGVHLLSSASREGGVRSWQWFEVLQGGSAHVARWDARVEAFSITASDSPRALPGVCASADDAELMRAARDLKFDASLGALPADSQRAWAELTRHVSAAVIARVVGARAGVGAARDVAPGVAAELAGASIDAIGDDACLKFMPLAGVARGATASARAMHARDSSSALVGAIADLCATSCGGDAARAAAEFMGEAEAAFALALCGDSFAGLEAWKARADAALRAESLLLGGVPEEVEIEVVGEAGSRVRAAASGALDAEWFEDMLGRVLPAQLLLLPPDFFTAEITNDAFLAPALRSLLRTTGSPPSPAAPLAARATRVAAGRILDTARAHFGWRPPMGARGSGDDAVDALCAGAPPPCSKARRASLEGFQTMDELLAALAEEGGDGDLPVIVGEARSDPNI